jgi:hypothetical protein
MDAAGAITSMATPLPIDRGLVIGRPKLAESTVFDEARFNPFRPSFDVDGGAARAVAAYDRNGDGVIDVSSSHRHLGSSETTRYDASGSHSIAELARMADLRGNRDGKATVAEIATVMRDFDSGGTSGLFGLRDDRADGRLDGSERRRFLEKYGERATNIVSPQPPSWPKPGPMPPVWPKPLPVPPMPPDLRRPEYADLFRRAVDVAERDDAKQETGR